MQTRKAHSQTFMKLFFFTFLAIMPLSAVVAFEDSTLRDAAQKQLGMIKPVGPADIENPEVKLGQSLFWVHGFPPTATPPAPVVTCPRIGALTNVSFPVMPEERRLLGIPKPFLTPPCNRLCVGLATGGLRHTRPKSRSQGLWDFPLQRP
jgi:hypothetical protein